MQNSITIFPITDIGEIAPGDSIAKAILQSLEKQQILLQEKDILIVTQKIISKAEGRSVSLSTIQPSAFAKQLAEQAKKDARQIEVVLRETKRIVRMDNGVLICETKHGFICANAGVDISNVGGEETVTLLPQDPDFSANKIREELLMLIGKKINIAIIISDTWGRPWREGQVNFAIGVSGMNALIDYRGQKDQYGHVLQVSEIGIADEIASAGELVMGKIDKVPVALLRGYQFRENDMTGKTLLRKKTSDMFR